MMGDICIYTVYILDINTVLDEILPCLARQNTTDDLWRLAGWRQQREQCFHWPQQTQLKLGYSPNVKGLLQTKQI